MKTYATLLVGLMIIAQSGTALAQETKTGKMSRSEMVEQNYIFQLTKGMPEHRSAYVMSALQFYVHRPELEREAIMQIFDNLVRNDTSMSVRYSALVASAVLKDSSLSSTCRRRNSEDLSAFAEMVMRETGTHLTVKLTSFEH